MRAKSLNAAPSAAAPKVRRALGDITNKNKDTVLGKGGAADPSVVLKKPIVEVVVVRQNRVCCQKLT